MSLNFFKVKQIDYEKLATPKISIILCTFREKPKFELLYESLSHQTLKNFELVIADFLYEKHIDYIDELAKKYKIPTVHVARDKYGVKAFNIGIANSSGDYMIHINDANYFPYQFVEKHMVVCTNNFLSLGTRYFTYSMPFPIEKYLTAFIEVPEIRDPEVSNKINVLSNGIKDYLYLNFGEHQIVSPQDFRLLGLPPRFMTEDNLIIDGAPGWSYGGNFSGPTELFLTLNGFDEEFDKGYGWSDCNIGVRAFNAGYKSFMNVSNWSLEIHDEDHDSVYNLLPEYELKESSEHNWKLYEQACDTKKIRANPNFDLRKVRKQTLESRGK